MNANETEPTFESALTQLERLVANLERGDLDLSASLASYEKGVALLSRCQSMLDAVDRSVALLTAVDPDGQAVVAPFDASATIDAATSPKPAKTSKPRAPKSAPASAPAPAPVEPSTVFDPAIDPPFDVDPPF